MRQSTMSFQDELKCVVSRKVSVCQPWIQKREIKSLLSKRMSISLLLPTRLDVTRTGREWYARKPRSSSSKMESYITNRSRRQRYAVPKTENDYIICVYKNALQLPWYYGGSIHYCRERWCCVSFRPRMSKWESSRHATLMRLLATWARPVPSTR